MYVFKLLFSIYIKGSLTGYFLEPQVAKCSKICGFPVLSSGGVLKSTANTLSIS